MALLARPSPGTDLTADGHSVLSRAVLILAALLACGGFAVQQSALVALAGGIAVCVLAAVRFDTFVIVLLVVRAALDATKDVGMSTTTAVGAVFLVAVVSRELLLRSSGAGPAPLRVAFRWPLFALLGAAVVSGLVSDAPAASLTEALRLAGVVAMVVALERLLSDVDNVARVLVAVFASSLVPLGVACYQLLLTDGRQIGSFSRVQGTFTHPNPYSIYLAVLVVLAVALVGHVKGWQRWALVVVTVLNAAMLVATYTRGSWIALVVGLLVVGALQGRWLLAGVVVAVAATVLLVPSIGERFSDLGAAEEANPGVPTNSLEWRVDHWRDAISMVEPSPVIGIGLKGIERESSDEANAHNDLLRVTVETGAAGLLAYLALAVTLVATARRALRAHRTGYPRGVAVGFAGVVTVLGVASLSSNIITQVVLLWYVAAIAVAAAAVTRMPPVPAARTG